MEEIKQENKLFEVDVKYLLGICKNIKDLVTEVRFNINKNGLTLTEIEPANVCMIDVELNSSNFIELTDNTETKTYGLSINDLFKILKEQSKQSVRVSEIDNKLILNFSNGFKSELSLIEIESEKKNIPNLEHTTTIEMDSKRFKEIVKNSSNVSDSLTIEKTAINKTEDNISFNAKGSTGNTELNLNSDEVRISGDNSKSKYSLEYLRNFIKEPISNKVTLKTSNDYPIIVEYLSDGFKIRYILAPRCETSD